MSPPRANTRERAATLAELQALRLDGETASLSVEELWSHVDVCSRSARGIAYDQVMRRALSRGRRSARAPEILRRRLRDALATHTVSGTKQPGGQSRST
jgi:hypothetical protein